MEFPFCVNGRTCWSTFSISGVRGDRELDSAECWGAIRWGNIGWLLWWSESRDNPAEVLIVGIINGIAGSVGTWRVVEVGIPWIIWLDADCIDVIWCRPTGWLCGMDRLRLSADGLCRMWAVVWLEDNAVDWLVDKLVGFGSVWMGLITEFKRIEMSSSILPKICVLNSLTWDSISWRRERSPSRIWLISILFLSTTAVNCFEDMVRDEPSHWMLEFDSLRWMRCNLWWWLRSKSVWCHESRFPPRSLWTVSMEYTEWNRNILSDRVNRQS